MSYSLDEIRSDLAIMPVKDFYIKHILRSTYWYFETILKSDEDNAIKIADNFKEIVSKELGVSFNNIAIVGSGKLGYSLAPRPDKLFSAFSINGETRKESDLDIAIISNRLFESYWDLFRKAYKSLYAYEYRYITREIYRGYINESHLDVIPLCRKEWALLANNSKRCLQNSLYIRHQIKYRIYRSWEDFEEYNILSLNIAKEKVNGFVVS